jgi:hypothetical protein
LSVFGDAPDRQALALALRFLELNSCLDCVMLLADQSERSIVFADQGVPAAAGRLVGVLWQLRGPGAVFDHVAKGIDRIDRADAVTRAFRAVAVGAQEETIAAPSAAWDIESGRRGPMTLADAATRIEVEAAATPEALFALVARGQAIFLRIGEDVRADAGLEPIFGLESYGRGYAGRLGALRISPDVRGIRVAAQGEDAEIWLYRGVERSPLLVTGGTTATIEQHKSPMEPGIHEAGSLETNGLDWTELSVWLVVGLPRERAAATLHMLGEAAPDAVVPVDDCDAVIRMLSHCPPRQVVLLCTAARLCEGDARRLETALAAHSDARALIALEPGLMFSQAWATHLAVAEVAAIKQGRVGLLAPSALARELEACGLTCRDWPDVDPPGMAPLRRRRRGSRSVRVLFSSSGPFAGMYGHTLSALAIAIDAVDVPSVSVDLLRPNEQSTHLIWDLQISDLVTICDDVEPGGYDLVVEVTPDDALSSHALEAMRLGAAAVLGPAAAALAPRGITVRIAEQWEAADAVAFDLRAALILAAGT